MQKSFSAKQEEQQPKTYVIDATDQILGKLAVKAANILRGKNKPTFTPHVDTGDQVIIINAEKIRVTGKKFTDKEYQKFSGYPSGQKVITFDKLQAKAPHKIIELAIKGMIPSGALGNRIYRKLKVYAGSEHPHGAQQPIPVTV